MKKIIYGMILMFVFVLSIAMVSADLTITPSTLPSVTFGNLEETKTVEFTLNNNWENDSMSVNIDIDYLNLGNDFFDLNWTFGVLSNGSSKDIKLTLDATKIANIELFEGLNEEIIINFEYTNESSGDVFSKNKSFDLTLPAYNKEINFNSDEFLINELPEKTFTKTIKLKNEGTVKVQNIILEISDEDFVEEHDISISPSNTFSLNSNEEKEITLTGKVSSNLGTDVIETSILEAKSTNDTIAQTNIKISAKSGLQFEDLEYDVRYPTRYGPDDIDDTFGEGNTIRIAEGARVIIEGDVENIFDDIELRRPEVTLEIKKMDRFEERYRLDDLIGGDYDSFMFEFTVPYEGYRDRDTFEAILYVEAEDRETNKEYKTEIKFTLEIIKEREEVTIINAYIENEVLSCNRETNLYVTIKNTGQDDLSIKDKNTASLRIINAVLGLDEIIYDIEMDADDYDVTNEQTFIIPIDASNLNPSTIFQNIRVIAYYDRDEESDEKIVLFKVEECTTPTTVAPSTTTTTTTVQQTTTTTLRQIIGPDANIIPSEPEKTDNERMYVILLIVLIAVIVLAIGGMIGYLMKK
jgi:hypothetical protein